MSSRQYITTTNLNEHHALAWQGAQAFASFKPLHRLLSSRLSPEHSALFAEPLPDDVRRNADWYYIGSNESLGTDPASLTGQPSQPVRLIDLSPEAQAPIREKLLTIGRDIYKLSQELKNSSDSNLHTAGNLLEMMLTFPGEEFIYVIGNTPVLIAWGFIPATGNTQSEMLTRLGAVPVAASLATPVAAPLATPNRFAPDASTTQTANDEQITYEAKVHNLAWLWALLAFLIGVILCGLLLYFTDPSLGGIGLSGCTRQVVPVHNATTSEGPNEELLYAQTLEHSLRAELERLHQELLARLARCEQDPLPEQLEEPLADPPIEQPPLEEETPEELHPPVPEFTLPDIPEDLPEDIIEEPAIEDMVEEPEDNNMEIPDQPENMEFLEGCWDAPTGLINVANNQPVIVEYCFDKSGNGSVRITELDKNGKPIFVCEGPAQAQLKGNQLSIDDNGAICPDKSRYDGNKLVCYKDRNNRTVCKGTSKGRSKDEWGPVPFRENQK